jgi:hypothetical protein
MTTSRKVMYWLGAAVPVSGLVLCAAVAQPPAKKAGPLAKAPGTVGGQTFERDALPFTKKYCLPCHQGDTPSAGVSLDEYKTEPQMLKARNLWEKVGVAVVSKHMPPPGMPQPTDAERQAFAGYVQGAISKADCAVKTPGRVTLRRLNRAEYNNTVRDLLGANVRPADDFPSDDVGYGFDNIGDVLSISPLLMEKYLEAARKVARASVYAPEDKQAARSRVFAASSLDGDGGDFPDTNGRILFSNGACGVNFEFPGPGKYKARVVAFEQKAGPEASKMSFQVGAKKVRTVQVRAVQKNPTQFDFEFEYDRAGMDRVSVTFDNDYYNDSSTDPKVKGDRNLIIQSVEIVPVSVTIADPKEFPAFHNKVMESFPNAGADGVIPDTAFDGTTRKVMSEFLPRAFRRPVAKAEVERYVGLARTVRKSGQSFEKGVQVAIQAALVSPNFLFMVEPNPKPGEAKRPLTDYEIATRLSYFVWSSMPDDRLFALAAQGKLKDPKTLNAEALRMLKDPKAKALADNFAGQWLNLRKLSLSSPDPKQFPGFSESLRNAMRTETDLFFMHVVTQDRPITDFLSSDYTFLNEPLAKHYGNADVKGDNFRLVKLGGGQRGGLISQASILTLTSNPGRTSPVKRGKWVMENILNTPPPPAPPNVPQLEDDKAEKGPLTGTLRQRMEQHRSNPACASCHTSMDSIGFGLENFDATGAWRLMDGETKIDAAATMPDGKSFSGPAGLRNYLLGRKDQFARAFAEKLLTFALGRGIEPYDRCNLDAMGQTVAKNGYKFSAVVATVVNSEPFRYRASGTMVADKPAPATKPAGKPAPGKKAAPAKRRG